MVGGSLLGGGGGDFSRWEGGNEQNSGWWWGGPPIHESLTWSSNISMLKAKLSKANVLLEKLRYYTWNKLLKTIYNALFESHIGYGCQIWEQTSNQHVTDVVKLQKKAVKIINSSAKYTSPKPLFNELRILSFDEIVNL